MKSNSDLDKMRKFVEKQMREIRRALKNVSYSPKARTMYGGTIQGLMLVRDELNRLAREKRKSK